MIASAEQEGEIVGRLAELTLDPLKFVRWVYPWGVRNTPFANLREPRKWQIEELEAYGDHLRQQWFAKQNDLPLTVYRAGWSSGRGPGKSAMFGMLAHHQVSTVIGSMAVVVANTETQLRSTTFPEFAKWFKSGVNAHWFKCDSMRISIEPELAEWAGKQPERGGLSITSDKWVVKGKTWTEDNPSAYVGEHNDFGMMCLFDEANGIAPFVWDSTEGFYTEKTVHRSWFAASQMRNRNGRFYEISSDPKMGKGWRFKFMSTRGMEGLDQKAIQSQIDRYGVDSDFVRVEIDGLPPRTSEDQFIPWDAIREAQQNKLAPDYGAPVILGVDPAPRGKTAWRFRQGRNARDCMGRDTKGAWYGKDNVQIANAVLELDSKYKPDDICIDFGMGTGVIDILKRKRLHGRLHEVKFGGATDKDSEFGSHGAVLWAAAREWLPGGMIEVDDGEKGSFSHQATDRGWRWSQREEGKKILESKEDLRSRGVASPDDFDAFACTFEVNPPRNDYKGRAGHNNSRVAEGVGECSMSA